MIDNEFGHIRARLRHGAAADFAVTGDFRYAEGGDFLRCALGEIGDAAVLDLAVVAEGLAQENAGVNSGNSLKNQ